MSPRARIAGLTALAAVLAAGGAVAVAALQGGTPEGAQATGTSSQPDGAPPLGLDLGVRLDADARALRRADALYAKGRLAAARAIFERSPSLEGRVGAAFASWPEDTLERMEQLAGLHPDRAVVLVNLGIARLWTGKGDAKAALRAGAQAEPDTRYRVVADNLLYPAFAPRIPVFVPTAPLPAGLDGLTPPAQLALLERNATTVDGKLIYGSALQRLGRQVSAEQMFAAAARQAPDDPEARVAAAVGRFTKSRPVDAFSRLGPLTRRFPEAATVRFHLGLLLLWSGQVKEAKRQLKLATEVEPGSPLAKEAATYLDRLGTAGG